MSGAFIRRRFEVLALICAGLVLSIINAIAVIAPVFERVLG